MPARKILRKREDMQKQIDSNDIESSLLRDAYFQLRDTTRKLEESELKYSTLVEKGNDGILIIDAKGTLQFVNSVICAMAGYSKEKVIGTPLLKYIAPEYKELVTRRLESRLRGEEVPSRYDIEILSGTGKKTPVEVNSTQIEFEGKPAVMAIVRDITERKCSELELQERDAHAQSLLRFSRRIEQAQTYGETLLAAQEEIHTIVGYENVWAYTLDPDMKHAHSIVARGSKADVIMSEEGTATLPVEGDPMMERIVKAEEIVIVEDAQIDPNVNREIVEKLRNRTIVNVPIILFNRHLGSIGMGTFGDEGIRVPTASEQGYLMAMASHMAVAFDRIRLLMEHDKSEKSLSLKNRALHMLSSVNAELIHATDESELLEKICSIVTEQGGYRMLWIGYKENDEEKTVRPVAHAGFESGYLEAAHVMWGEDTEYGRGPVGTAIRTGKLQIVKDIAKEPSMGPWHKLAFDHGYHSIIALPLLVANQAFGALVIYGDKPDAFSEDEVAILDELANDLAFGVTSLRIDAERRRGEERLRRNAEDLQKFKLALDNASDQVIITDTEGMVIYVNPAIERVTGYKPEEVVGKKSGSLWKSPMPVEFYKRLWHTIKDEKKTFTGEIQNRRRSGAFYTALLSISPVIDDEGNIIFFVGIERDITKEKEIDTAKSEFISLASHQMRTPLTAINWYSEMLLDGDAGALNEKQADYFREIHAASQKMNETVKSFMHILRFETGSVLPNPVPINLRDMTEALLGELQVDINKKHIAVTRQYQASLRPISTDSEFVRVILQNLLSNAVKYSSQGGVLTVSLSNAPQGSVVAGKTVTEESIFVGVSDTGIGIPVEDRDKIFDKFFRAENARKQDPNGNGLGLYMVKFMADIVGGTIWFESEEGKGTTFYLLLPLVWKKVIQ